MHSWIRCSSFFIASSIAFTASAAVFPDVPDGHQYQQPIEQLVNVGVVNGNPDGNFYPDRAVNRAEMLKLLYLANGIQPDASSRDCFLDVALGSWYEPFVCDAAARRFVVGYADGSFKPGMEVNRVEALKMIQEVFGFPVDEISEKDREIIQFVDVSVAAWYTKYLFNAYEIGILPIAGQDASRFYPEAALKRGEAAAMIYNALYADIQARREATEMEMEEEDNTMEEEASQQNTTDEDEIDVINMLSPGFPMYISGKFNGKSPFSYKFDIHKTTVVSTEVSLQNGQPGDISCVLFLLEESGFSNEYYIGVQEDGTCSLLTTLTPGSYQLQLQPTNADTTYSFVSNEGTGDGNDGFVEAERLSIGGAKTEILAQGNIQNWYTYTVNNPSGIRMKLDLTNSANLTCIVYAMADVDLYGFSGPECGQYYTYPPGTYYFGVTRKLTKGARQTYTIILGK